MIKSWFKSSAGLICGDRLNIREDSNEIQCKNYIFFLLIQEISEVKFAFLRLISIGFFFQRFHFDFFSDFMLRILDAEEPSESKINWNYPDDSVWCNFTCLCLFFSLSVLIHLWPFTWAFPPVVGRRRLALGHEEAALLFVFIWEETGDTNRKRWAVIPTEQTAPARSERRMRASKWNVAETLRERSVRHLMKQRRGDAAASDWNGAKTKHLMGASGASLIFFIFFHWIQFAKKCIRTF